MYRVTLLLCKYEETLVSSSVAVASAGYLLAAQSRLLLLWLVCLDDLFVSMQSQHARSVLLSSDHAC